MDLTARDLLMTASSAAPWAEIGRLAGALGLGVAIGLFYFGGLWWTVRRMPTARRPELWILVGFYARAGLGLTAIFFASGGRWDGLMACVIGFMAARMLLTRRIGEVAS